MNKNQEQLDINGIIAAIEQLIDCYTVPWIDKEDKAKTKKILSDLKSRIFIPVSRDSVKDVYILSNSEVVSLCNFIIQKIDSVLDTP